MGSQLSTISSRILHHREAAELRLNKRVRQLSSGDRITQPGDDVTAFQEISALQNSRVQKQAEMNAMQARLNWFRTSEAYLGQIREVLSAMSQLSIQASSTATTNKERDILDAAFQKYKQQISEIVDGKGGTLGVAAQFQGMPLFVGYAPAADIGAAAIEPDAGIEDINLFTGYGREGFPSLTLNAQGTINGVSTSGTAQGGTTSSITLATTHLPLNDLYKGMQLEITGGTGAGQTVTITGYTASSGEASVSPAFSPPPDNTSTYTITDQMANSTLGRVGWVSEVTFAEHVWGADNDRPERLQSNSGTFRALTTEEAAYRQTNGIADTDLEAKTYEEKLFRRQFNIFDPEFGSLRTSQQSERMLVQVENAIKKISHFLAHHDAKGEALRFRFEAAERRVVAETEGIDSLKNTDFAEATAEYQQILYNTEAMISVATRRDQLYNQLNALVRDGGG